MKIEVEPNCPLDKFKPCRQHKCAWFTQVRGTDPNSGNEVDEWGCAMSWMPMLILEGAAQSRSAGSAIESFRNEMVRANQDNLKLLADQFPPQTLKDKLIEG